MAEVTSTQLKINLWYKLQPRSNYYYIGTAVDDLAEEYVMVGMLEPLANLVTMVTTKFAMMG